MTPSFLGAVGLGRLLEHIDHLNLGMMGPFLVLDDRTVNGISRTPLKARITRFTMMLPYGSVIRYLDISYRADPGTDPAAVACFTYIEARVRQGNEFIQRLTP